MGIEFWQEKWREKNTPWDLGRPHPSLAEIWEVCEPFLKQVNSPSVLELGCGGGHDAAFLAERGCMITGLDLSLDAVALAEKRYGKKNDPGFFPKYKQVDFFSDFTSKDLELAALVYDRALLCALPPSLRPKFWKKIRETLSIGSLYATIVASCISDQEKEGPPYEVGEAELLDLLEHGFDLVYYRCNRQTVVSPAIKEEIIFIVRKTSNCLTIKSEVKE